MSDQIYRLRWNSNGSAELNLSEAFRIMRDNSELFDVSLGTAKTNGSGKPLRAHKVILSAYSPAFKEMFRHNSRQSDPFIYLKGVTYMELSNLLDFMYNGEVNVTKANLNDFLLLAEDLQIKGLAKGNTFGSNRQPKQTTNSGSKPRIIERDSATRKAPKYESVSQYFKKEERFDDDNTVDDWGQMKIKEEPMPSQEKIAKFASKPRTDNLQENDDDEPDVPVLEGETGVVEDFIRNMSKHLYTGNQKRSVSKCRICLRELRRDKIKQHIRGTHPTYLVAAMPQEEVSSSNAGYDDYMASMQEDSNDGYDYGRNGYQEVIVKG